MCLASVPKRREQETLLLNISREDKPACELCLRQPVKFTVHHLVPRSQGGKLGPKVQLCPTCHHQLHALFSEATLAKEFHSVEQIRANTEMAAYLNWVRKQKDPTNFRVRRSKHRR